MANMVFFFTYAVVGLVSPINRPRSHQGCPGQDKRVKFLIHSSNMQKVIEAKLAGGSSLIEGILVPPNFLLPTLALSTFTRILVL